MRGKVTDQDLTNYALNELPASERLYVESMLGISEECRHDVYQMLDLSEMLREGCEAEGEAATEFVLDDERRAKVLAVPHWDFRALLQRAAAVLLLASGAAYAMTRPALWREGGAADTLASATQAVQTLADDIQTKSFAQTAAEFTARIQQTATVTTERSDWQFVATPAVCTPTPVWADMPVMPDIGEM